MAKDVIIALDFPCANDVYQFLDKFEGKKPFVKIGMELFYSEGPQIVREIKKRGHKIFLDLKLCDIPNTVKSAMKVLTKLDVDIVNVHAFGSINMMKAGLLGVTREDETRPLIIAITQLTSISEEIMQNELLINEKLDKTVMKYAKNAKEAGLDGIVCSPMEAGKVHKECGNDFITVTPGIRFSENTKGDQVRVTTPKMAKELGSDYIVVGRPITRDSDPVKAYNKCVKEFLGK